jgi:hypothetical protein
MSSQDLSHENEPSTEHDGEGENRPFRARIVSFAARSTRLKGRQEKAWAAVHFVS